jgi:hypothetical protein
VAAGDGRSVRIFNFSPRNVGFKSPSWHKVVHENEATRNQSPALDELAADLEKVTHLPSAIARLLLRECEARVVRFQNLRALLIRAVGTSAAGPIAETTTAIASSLRLMLPPSASPRAEAGSSTTPTNCRPAAASGAKPCGSRMTSRCGSARARGGTSVNRYAARPASCDRSGATQERAVHDLDTQTLRAAEGRRIAPLP